MLTGGAGDGLGAVPREDAGDAAVERAARGSYARLLALLVRRTGDIAGCEDALAEAFARAVAAWREGGVPRNPDGWLMRTAGRIIIDQARSSRAFHGALSGIAQELLSRASGDSQSPIEDETLHMLFLCTHPALDPVVRTPLMLQTVLGVPAASIASAFLTSPSALAQRLTRAKAKVKQTRMRFELPEAAEFPARLSEVLECIYGAYALGWDALGTHEGRLAGLAVYLGERVVELLPQEPEPLGLLALMLFGESRSAARRADGYVPVLEQRTELWDAGLIDRAENLLRRASGMGGAGRFQLEAAIQSVHAARARTGRVDFGALHVLYGRLLDRYPTVGAVCAYAGVLMLSSGAERALTLLDSLSAGGGMEGDARATPSIIAAHQPYWATRAAVLRALGDRAGACAAYERAAGLSDDPAVRAWLLTQRAGVLSRS